MAKRGHRPGRRGSRGRKKQTPSNAAARGALDGAPLTKASAPSAEELEKKLEALFPPA